MSQFYCYYCIFKQINAALVSVNKNIFCIFCIPLYSYTKIINDHCYHTPSSDAWKHASGYCKERNEFTIPTFMPKEPVTSTSVVDKHHSDQGKAVKKTEWGSVLTEIWN